MNAAFFALFPKDMFHFTGSPDVTIHLFLAFTILHPVIILTFPFCLSFSYPFSLE
jgi:hypothetical protein